jgi:hypothetical protein
MAVIATPKPMLAKAVLRRLKISQQRIAFQAGRSTAQVSNVLNGWIRDDAVEDAIVTLVGNSATHSELFGSKS